MELGKKKRPANDENVEPLSSEAPPTKQPRTIDINLPNRWEDFASSENTAKGTSSVCICTNHTLYMYTLDISARAIIIQLCVCYCTASKPNSIINGHCV